MNDNNMKHVKEQFEMQNRLEKMLTEARNEMNQEFDPNENLNIYTENARASFNWGDRDNSQELLYEEYQEKLQDVSRDLFIATVVESCPIDKNVIKLNESEIESHIGGVYDAMLEAGIIKNIPEDGAWSVLMKTVAKHAVISGNSADTCFNESVDDCKLLLVELTERVGNKVKEAIKFENFNTSLKEDASLRKENVGKTMFRTLIENNYKANIEGEEDQLAMLQEDVREQLTQTSMIQATIDYAILETCNTARIVDLDADYVEKGYRFFGKR